MEERLTKSQIKEQRHQERQQWEAQLAKDQKINGIKKIGMWVSGVVILALSVWGLIALVNTPQPTSQITNIPPVNSSDITMGSKSAKATLVEYADFQCPACAAYHPLVKQLTKEFDGKVLFVYRFYPLTSIHKNAMKSAEAAFAAYNQGKFWEMHNVLFEHQNDWAESNSPEDTFTKYAQNIHLDMTKYTLDTQGDKTIQFINNESDGGTTAGINSTPTFFINGHQIQNPQSYDAFKQLIQNALK